MDSIIISSSPSENPLLMSCVDLDASFFTLFVQDAQRFHVARESGFERAAAAAGRRRRERRRRRRQKPREGLRKRALTDGGPLPRVRASVDRGQRNAWARLPSADPPVQWLQPGKPLDSCDGATKNTLKDLCT